MQAAFHHRFDFTCAGQRNRFLGSGMAMLCRDQRVGREIHIVREGDRLNFVYWADQDRHDQVGLGSLDGAEQSVAIHRVNDSGADGREFARQVEQVPVPGTMFVQMHFWQNGPWPFHFLRRGNDLCIAPDDHFATLIDALAVKDDAMLFCFLCRDGDGDGDGITDGDGTAKVQGLTRDKWRQGRAI